MVETLAEKNQAAIQLLDEWLADESGYDEETWPMLAEALGLPAGGDDG